MSNLELLLSSRWNTDYVQKIVLLMGDYHKNRWASYMTAAKQSLIHAYDGVLDCDNLYTPVWSEFEVSNLDLGLEGKNKDAVMEDIVSLIRLKDVPALYLIGEAGWDEIKALQNFLKRELDASLESLGWGESEKPNVMRTIVNELGVFFNMFSEEDIIQKDTLMELYNMSITGNCGPWFTERFSKITGIEADECIDGCCIAPMSNYLSHCTIIGFNDLAKLLPVGTLIKLLQQIWATTIHESTISALKLADKRQYNIINCKSLVERIKKDRTDYIGRIEAWKEENITRHGLVQYQVSKKPNENSHYKDIANVIKIYDI